MTPAIDNFVSAWDIRQAIDKRDGNPYFGDAAFSISQKVICPECKTPSRASEWGIGIAPCEDCGEHSAIVCPICDEAIDIIGSIELEVVKGVCMTATPNPASTENAHPAHADADGDV